MSTTDKRGWSGCGCGCSGVLFLGLFIFIVAQFQPTSKKEEVVVGTTLYKTSGAVQTMGLAEDMSEQRRNHSVLLTQDIWDAIHEHPSVNRLVLCLILGTSRSLMVDKYGNKVSDVFNYKIIEVNDVAEIRKYTDAGAYSFDQASRYESELDDLAHGDEYTSFPKFTPDEMERALHPINGRRNGSQAPIVEATPWNHRPVAAKNRDEQIFIPKAPTPIVEATPEPTPMPETVAPPTPEPTPQVIATPEPTPEVPATAEPAPSPAPVRKALPVRQAAPAPKAQLVEDLPTKRFNEGFAEGKAWAKDHTILGVQDALMAQKRGYTGEERRAYIKGWEQGFYTNAKN